MVAGTHIVNKIANSPSDINWKVQGVARIENATTLQDKQFSDDLLSSPINVNTSGRPEVLD